MDILRQNGETKHDMEVLLLALYALSFSLVCFSIILLHLRKLFTMRAVVLLLASVLCGLVISKYTCSPSPSLLFVC
jgi:hypothetical protein